MRLFFSAIKVGTIDNQEKLPIAAIERLQAQGCDFRPCHGPQGVHGVMETEGFSETGPIEEISDDGVAGYHLDSLTESGDKQ